MLDGTVRGAGYGFSGGGVDAYVEIFAAPKGVIECVGVGGVVVGSSHRGCGGGEIVRGGCHLFEKGFGSSRGKLFIFMGSLLIDITYIKCECGFPSLPNA